MRTSLALLTTALMLLAWAPLAQAQPSDDDGCTQRDPCPWIIEVTADGFRYVEGNRSINLLYETEFTLGDWYEITLSSDDDAASHTVTLSGHEVSVTVGPGGITEDTEVFQFDQLGTFKLRDQPSGDERDIHVQEEDTVDDDGSGTQDEDEEGAPGMAWPLLSLALVAIAVLRRRVA